MERWEQSRTVAEEIGWDLTNRWRWPKQRRHLVGRLARRNAQGRRGGRPDPAGQSLLGALTPAANIGPGRYSQEWLSRHWIDVDRAYHYRRAGIGHSRRTWKLSGSPEEDQDRPGPPEVFGRLFRSHCKNDLVELRPCAPESPEPAPPEPRRAWRAEGRPAAPDRTADSTPSPGSGGPKTGPLSAALVQYMPPDRGTSR